MDVAQEDIKLGMAKCGDSRFPPPLLPSSSPPLFTLLAWFHTPKFVLSLSSYSFSSQPVSLKPQKEKKAIFSLPLSHLRHPRICQTNSPLPVTWSSPTVEQPLCSGQLAVLLDFASCDANQTPYSHPRSKCPVNSFALKTEAHSLP